MRYLLDTTVLSALAGPEPGPGVLEWLDEQSQVDLVLSVLTVGEIAQRVERLSPGGKRDWLREWLKVDLPRRFRDRVLG
jgi:predicted nucleic acid-binding protein